MKKEHPPPPNPSPADRGRGVDLSLARDLEKQVLAFVLLLLFGGFRTRGCICVQFASALGDCI
eukprot:3075062-Lingulodinium_polyedra.AAC.1